MSGGRSKTREAIRNELVNFNSFQDAQLDALTSIAESLSSTLESSISVKDDLRDISNILSSMSRSATKTDMMLHTLDRTSSDSTESIKKSSNKIIDISDKLVSGFSRLAKVVAETSNRYSQLSNTLISVSGARGSDVRETRSEIVHDIISQLNKETGTFFNPEKSYEKIINIAAEAGIGDLDTIEKITRPMLLATESMNINQGELASILNRWYTRYNFSSASMESMVDDIRGNTAGNNATAEATLKNLNKFQNFIGVYADNEEEMRAMSEAISAESSRLESVGINSGYIMDYMYQIGTGDLSNATSILSLLANSGTGLDWTSASAMLRSGDKDMMIAVSEALADGAIAIGEKLKDSTVTAEALKGFGLDTEEIYNLLSASGVLLTPEEFEDSTADAQTAVKSIDDKFNTVTDKLSNLLNSFSEFAAMWQERTGIAWSDIISLMTGITGVIMLGKVGGLGSLGAAVTSGITGRTAGFIAGQKMQANMLGSSLGLSGGLATGAGLLAGTAGVAGGGLLAIDGIKGVFDSEQSTGSRVLSGVEAGAGAVGVGTLIGAGLSNPVGWIALAVGGAAYLGKKWYENANELSGNAEQVSSQIESIGDSLKKENDTRLRKISILSYQFDQTSDVEEKRRLMIESGLFDQEELSNTADDQLKRLIDSYKNAAGAMNTVTDNILGIAERYATDEQNLQQEEFISQLMDVDDSERMNVLNLLKGGISDADTLKKIEEAMEDSKVTNSEWKDILSGGKNAWFDKNNLHDQTLDANAMNLVSGYLGWGTSYSDGSEVYEAAKLYSALSNATSKSEFNKIIESIKEGNFEEAIEKIYGTGIIDQIKKAKGYAVGSNYIESDQLAYLHEGEAVLPKRYNPAANTTELDMLRKYYQENTSRESAEYLAHMKELAEILAEIKEFLKYWRDDNIRRDTAKSRLSNLSANSNYISHYMTT